MRYDFNTDGVGYGNEAVVATVLVTGSNGEPTVLFDLRVGDYLADGITQPIVVATGWEPLVVANPQTQGVLTQRGQLTSGTGNEEMAPDHGQSVVLGGIANRDLALVSGMGTARGGASTSILAVVDLADVWSPQVLTMLELDAGSRSAP